MMPLPSLRAFALSCLEIGFERRGKALGNNCSYTHFSVAQILSKRLREAKAVQFKKQGHAGIWKGPFPRTPFSAAEA